MQVDQKALRQAGVRLVAVFGSRARGTNRPESDADVGVQFGTSNGVDLARLDRVRAALSADGEIDLVALDLADPLLLYEVAVDGRPLFEFHEGAWEEFRILAIKRYYDTAWIRRIEAAALKKRQDDGSPGRRPA